GDTVGRRLQHDLVGGHVIRPAGSLVGQQPNGQLFHRRTGSLTAFTSSGRLRPSVCGAACRNADSSSIILRSASAKASSVLLLSVSVGSIIIASFTTSGK